MTTKSLQEASDETGIPVKELRKLLALPYRKGDLPRPIAIKNLGFAKVAIETLRTELESSLRQTRKDAQRNVNHAFRLIVCNLVVSVVSKRRLSLAGTEKSYNKGTYLQSLFLTFRAVNAVTKALIKAEYLIPKKGSKIREEVNSYQPTKKLEILLLPLIYEIQEEYKGNDETLVIYKSKALETRSKGSETKGKGESRGELLVHSSLQNHTMRRRSYSPELPPEHPDRAGLKHINEYLKDVTYALKSPVKRIFSYEDHARREIICASTGSS
jgi:hypothetical protein